MAGGPTAAELRNLPQLLALAAEVWGVLVPVGGLVETLSTSLRRAQVRLTAELARLVKARHFEVMERLGHFPMSESPRQFRRYLLPVLDRIATDGAG